MLDAKTIHSRSNISNLTLANNTFDSNITSRFVCLEFGKFRSIILFIMITRTTKLTIVHIIINCQLVSKYKKTTQKIILFSANYILYTHVATCTFSVPMPFCHWLTEQPNTYSFLLTCHTDNTIHIFTPSG